MGKIVVSVERLGKQYHIAKVKNKHCTLRDSLVGAVTGPFRRANKLMKGQATGASELDETIWALKDISFEVKQGEVVGFLGANGAGKSTLLKILSRITEPTIGSAEIRGRVSSLLEVGTGFHQELSGRENIYLNGAILGMRRREIDRKFDEIVAFSEVGRFIDTPIKHYSSGMALRLAFAVAAHLEPEIMIVDEVLAVGDASFQKKCIGKMGDVAKQGRTVLFVSHNMGAVTQLCSRALWLEKGQLKYDDSAINAVSSYLLSGTESCGVWDNPLVSRPGQKVQLQSANVVSMNHQPVGTVDYNTSFRIEIGYVIIEPVRHMSIVFQLIDSMGQIIFESTDHDATSLNGQVRMPGKYLSICNISSHLLRPGRYFISLRAFTEGIKMFDKHDNVLTFDISYVGYHMHQNRLGLIAPLFKWDIVQTDTQDYEKYTKSPRLYVI